MKGKDNKLPDLFSHSSMLQELRGQQIIWWLNLSALKNDNKLKIFPPNLFKFKSKDHIIIDKVQEYILDNF
jgi:hypothetical protein